jgi:hypothetical protein
MTVPKKRHSHELVFFPTGSEVAGADCDFAVLLTSLCLLAQALAQAPMYGSAPLPGRAVQISERVWAIIGYPNVGISSALTRR